MAQRKISIDLTPKVKDILQNARLYHNKYYTATTFAGPSLYFHRRALGLEGEISKALRLEIIYAALMSWGMHRMGQGGSKMVSFEVFQSSVTSLSSELGACSKLNPANIRGKGWSLLEKIFKGIKVMASRTSLVGNSKVMAHLLPYTVAPIDREYTLKYLFHSGSLQNNLDYEWLLMRKILSEFFHPIANDSGLQKRAAQWTMRQTKYPWDTAIIKVIDNLVIGGRKQNTTM